MQQQMTNILARKTDYKVQGVSTVPNVCEAETEHLLVSFQDHRTEKEL